MQRKLIYHVGTTLDNYIAHEDGSTDGFSAFMEGEHVTEYLESLKAYDTVLMGKATYEYGYQFGVQPGQPSPTYPHMKHYIFSKTLRFDTEPDEQVKIIDKNELEFVKQLKEEEGTDIYLCGGGTFAGFLFENELIDELIIKLYPVIFGSGIRLFGKSTKAIDLSLINSKVYKTGVLLLTYKLNYK
ncbi:dihydrofolate reductase family protein [Brasilonema sp. UFV-L1]|uniref:dihydrofolate reductase family protein n=1 Tax=Brasilonema sp. UFV-L1 TaxID=2234130 RepID=UPI00145CABE8|nr:dihydrofolate reductase family protein [Brasilonema sp. UFV-L1]NMG10708.1 dihydrofolate reductase [Brasilonema sp. UFV-L1]